MDDHHALISQLAHLARLKLTPEETEAFSQQIPNIVAYVDQLKNVDIDMAPDVDPVVATLRPDIAEPSGVENEIRSQGPTMADRFWKVPTVK